MSDDIQLDDLAAQRLLSHMYPTPTVRLLGHLKMGLWSVSESGPFLWLGNRIDHLELRLHDRRARKALRAGKTIGRSRGNVS